jgi:hypothetical protein
MKMVPKVDAARRRSGIWERGVDILEQ